MLLALLIALAAGGYALWQYLSSYESTDDAQVDGHVNAISARISGHLSEVLVEDAQMVKAGDVLVKIDPRDYEVAVSKAEADLADAEASLQKRAHGPSDRFHHHGEHASRPPGPRARTPTPVSWPPSGSLKRRRRGWKPLKRR